LELRTVGDTEFATFDLAPVLYVRGYF